MADEVHHGDSGNFRQPRNAVPTYSILPLERLAGIFKYKHKAVKDSSPKMNRPENDAPICKLIQDERQHEKVIAIATRSGNGSKDIFQQKQIPLSVECPKATPKLSSVHEEHSIGKSCAEVEYSEPTEVAQQLQVESQIPNSGSSALPTTFSGLFQSILASENPSSQLVEAASQPNGPLAASSIVPAVQNQAVQDIAITTTRLILDSLNQPRRRSEPPGFVRLENALESSNRMKPTTAVSSPRGRPDSYREARVSSAAASVSAAASAAKSAVQAAEASIEALAQLGINNGSLYQGRNSFMNPQPLQVLKSPKHN